MATPKSARRRLSAAERRERILEAAMAVFAERGYSEASMVEIATIAGITPAVIYDHFSSKADLQITLLESQTEELLAFVGAAILEAPDDLAERMRLGCEAFFAFVEQHGYAWRMLFRDPPTEPAIVEAHRRIHRRATEGIAAFLRASSPEALRDEPDADLRAEMLAQQLKMAQNGLAVWWYDHREIPRSVLVDRLMEFCWIGLERVAQGERADR